MNPAVGLGLKYLNPVTIQISFLNLILLILKPKTIPWSSGSVAAHVHLE